MTRLFALCLVGLAAALYFPRSRDVVVARAMPLLNPALRWQSMHEMDMIADEVVLSERDELRRIFDPKEFPRWVSANFSEDAARDAWGGTYRIFSDGQTFRIVSWGPDHTPRTADDLSISRGFAP